MDEAQQTQRLVCSIYFTQVQSRNSKQRKVLGESAIFRALPAVSSGT